LRIADCGLRIEERQNFASLLDVCWFLSVLLQSAIRNPQSAIRNPQSAIRNPQSAIRNPRLHVRKPPDIIDLL
jgi:major type 1 subunit fimbrin (pilin)